VRKTLSFGKNSGCCDIASLYVKLGAWAGAGVTTLVFRGMGTEESCSFVGWALAAAACKWLAPSERCKGCAVLQSTSHHQIVSIAKVSAHMIVQHPADSGPGVCSAAANSPDCSTARSRAATSAALHKRGSCRKGGISVLEGRRASVVHAVLCCAPTT